MTGVFAKRGSTLSAAGESAKEEELQVQLAESELKAPLELHMIMGPGDEKSDRSQF